MEISYVIIGIVLVAAAYFYGQWQKNNSKLQGLYSLLENTESVRDKAIQDHIKEHEARIAAEKEIERIKAELKHLKEQTPVFENLANKILEENNKKFSESSEKSLKFMLNPLREKIEDFNKKIDNSAKDTFALKNQIEKIVMEANSLSRALRGDSKTQGNWGEIMLERILEDSGLVEGQGYEIQGKGLQLTNARGERIQPDVIINLPDGKHIIIDAKCSITFYDRYINSTEEAEKEKYLKQFIDSVRAHIKGLSEKQYHSAEKLESPDFVMMFMPIEGAYMLAVQADRELHKFAWDRKVALVCPSTLFMSMQTIASLWKHEMQNRNALEIARQSGALYDKFCGFIDDMQDIGKSIKKTDEAYAKAMNKLSEGRGNLLISAEKIKKLGAKAEKSIPQELVSSEAIEQLEDA